jgi:hypothetical protein
MRKILVNKIPILNLAEIIKIEKGFIIIKNVLTDEITKIKSDILILSINRIPNDNSFFVSALVNMGVKVSSCGDCIFPRGIETAIYEANQTVHKLGIDTKH